MLRSRTIRNAIAVMALGVIGGMATAATLTYTPTGGTATNYTPGSSASLAAATAAAPLGATGATGIRGSLHDFGQTAWAGGEICAPCHAPHNTNPTYATITSNGSTLKLLSGPLWNHQLPNNGTYTMYTGSYVTSEALGTGYTSGGNSTVNVTYSTAQTGQNVDTNSLLCLSCHDGTIALDSFGGASGKTFMNGGQIGGMNFGTDLTNDHPIGAAAVYTGQSYLVAQGLRDAAGIMPMRLMPDGTTAVGCTTCHEPHNRTGNQHFLWVPNNSPGVTVDGRAVSGSLLCMNCHKK